MKLLAYDRLAEFLARDHPDEAARAARLVGKNRRHDSGYVDIIRFFGDAAIDPHNIELEYLQEQFRISDPRIAAFAQRIAAYLRDEGRLYDGPLAMRLSKLDLKSSPMKAIMQPSDYAEQAGSSFALDAEDSVFAEWGGTLRDYVRKEYRQKGIPANPLAVCLGVCAMVLVENGSKQYLLMGRRSSHLASLENSFGPSVAGSVDFKEEYSNLGELFRESLSQELEEEIGLRHDEYSIWSLALATEVMRGERPQLFGLVTTELPCEEVLSRIAGLSGRPEIEDVRLVKWEDVADLNYEGWMNYWLAEEWVGE